MDPSQFPNPHSIDDDMPMFGGGGGARWPGHEDYRVETPGSVGSTFVSDPDEFDPFFDTTAYPIEDMEPSCGQPPAPVPPRRRKKMARKEMAPSVPVPLPSGEPNEEYATGRTDYEMAEYAKVAQCWVDISEDSISSNNQTSARMWDRIEARYNETKPSWAFKRTKSQLRKCWDRIKLHVNNFSYIYNRNRDARGSGESMEDVLKKSMSEYQKQYGQFTHYDIWLMLKDKAKFNGGIPVRSSSAAKRTKNTAAGSYTSSGPSPMDLNAEPEGSSGTPTSTFRRPIGRKAAQAQAKGKGKAAASGSAPPQAPPSTQLVASALEEFGGFREVAEYRFILDAQNNLHTESDPDARRRTQNISRT